MALNGSQVNNIQQTLLNAFTKEDLEQLTRIHLDARLETIADGRNLTDIVFNLINWADQNGRVVELVKGACSQNPSKQELTELAEEMANWLELQPAEEGDSPYKGLTYFDVDDADLFFGREQLTAELVSHLRQNRFLAVVGASGSGKSSLVRAGLVPALQRGKQLAGGIWPPEGSIQWPIHIITPTARPLETLATQLVPDFEPIRAIKELLEDLKADATSLHLYVGRLLSKNVTAKTMVLIVDQFEELFTQCRDRNQRRAFINNLLTAAAPDGHMTVVITLRADFYAYCLEFDALRAALENQQKTIGPWDVKELRRAIETPAQLGNWELEPGLVDLLLQDVGNEPGALPLLSHALLATWQERSGRTLTIAGYLKSGRVQGAIAQTAETVLRMQLTPEQQTVARQIFLRLTELGEGTQDTRRRVDLDELVKRPEEQTKLEAVLKVLVDARLVTTFEEEAEVAHEALIREWPTLRRWLNDNREWLRLHHRLTEAAQEWERLSHAPDLLYPHTLLEQIQEQVQGHEDELNQLEHTFLQASQDAIAMAERQQDAARLRDLEQIRTARNRAVMAFAAAATALALAIIVVWQLYDQNRKLQGGRLIAEAELLRKKLDVEGAIEKYRAAEKVAQGKGVDLGIDISQAISDTRRDVAMIWVQQGEELLRGTRELASATARDQAIISATTLFSQAVALDPPPDTPIYVKIPKGPFLMGAGNRDKELAAAAQTQSDPNASLELSQHEVSLDTFWIQRTEVTNAQYLRCVEADECDPPINGNISYLLKLYADTPVTGVNWYQAQKYANWAGGRLPTEAEWEKACRGEYKPDEDVRVYPWGNEEPTTALANYGWFSSLNDVGRYTQGASPYGVLDIAGNVWEWTYSAGIKYQAGDHYNPQISDSSNLNTYLFSFGLDFVDQLDAHEQQLPTPIREKFNKEGYLFGINSQSVNVLEKDELFKTVRDEFRNQDRPLSDDVRLTVEEIGSMWALEDISTGYLIQNENQILKVYKKDYALASKAYLRIEQQENVWTILDGSWYQPSRTYEIRKVKDALDVYLNHKRVLRGGSFGGPTDYLRCASRGYFDPNTYAVYGGFRVVVSPETTFDRDVSKQHTTLETEGP